MDYTESFNPTNSIELITNLINKLVIPRFPKITGVEEIEHFSSGFRGDSYYVHIMTSECLEMEEQVEIDSLVKQLFKMASLDTSNKNFGFKLCHSLIVEMVKGLTLILLMGINIKD